MSVILHLNQIGNMKNLNRWMPCELTANKKKAVILKCRHPLFYAQQRTISRSDCDMR